MPICKGKLYATVFVINNLDMYNVYAYGPVVHSLLQVSWCLVINLAGLITTR